MVYFMTQVRKILENMDSTPYQYLKFYCDWVLHTKLSKNHKAQEILNQFDAANIQLKSGLELSALPTSLRNEIDQISKMNLFRQEIHTFLKDYALPPLDTSPDSWAKFLLLYARVIEDCTLEIKATNTAASIENVTVKVELAKQMEHCQMYYKISWIVLDKKGKVGEIYVLNSFNVSKKRNGGA